MAKSFAGCVAGECKRTRFCGRRRVPSASADATLAGASLREVAEGLFGADAVADDWHADSALRARVRRLVRRANGLMRGGYRRLAQLPPVPPHEGDVSHPLQNVPEQEPQVS